MESLLCALSEAGGQIILDSTEYNYLSRTELQLFGIIFANLNGNRTLFVALPFKYTIFYVVDTRVYTMGHKHMAIIDKATQRITYKTYNEEEILKAVEDIYRVATYIKNRLRYRRIYVCGELKHAVYPYRDALARLGIAVILRDRSTYYARIPISNPRLIMPERPFVGREASLYSNGRRVFIFYWNSGAKAEYYSSIKKYVEERNKFSIGDATALTAHNIDDLYVQKEEKN